MKDMTQSPVPRMADTMYHDMLSPPEVVAIRAEVRDFAERVLRPRARARIRAGARRDEGRVAQPLRRLDIPGRGAEPHPQPPVLDVRVRRHQADLHKSITAPR